jgi:hypothetical protein
VNRVSCRRDHLLEWRMLPSSALMYDRGVGAGAVVHDS